MTTENEVVIATIEGTPDVKNETVAPATSAPVQAQPKPKTAMLKMVALTGGAVAAALWGVWVTSTITKSPMQEAGFVTVNLQPLIQEYVQAQARTNTPPELVTQQTQAFMLALEEELKRRGANGQTIVVAEAVISKNLPDITADVRRAIYGRVPAPMAQAVPAAPAPVMGGGPGAPLPPQAAAAPLPMPAGEYAAAGGANGQP